MATITRKLRNAWNAFTSETEQERQPLYAPGGGMSIGRPDRVVLSHTSKRSIVASIYNQLSIDIASVDIRHAKLDQNERYVSEIKSPLNECLSLEANIDQAARAFRQDLAMSLFENGVAAIVPVDTSDDPNETQSYDIYSMRVGEVTAWYPTAVRVRVYNERSGKKEEVTLPKSLVAIVENPLYSVMNEPNSTLQRLMRKLALLDNIDEEVGAGKLDLIIQLPYVIKSEARREQAETRRKDIEFQLQGSKHGIAYTDGTEKITQLNRSVDNQLLPQIEDLTKQLYNQLGLTAAVFDGTASEATMLNYYNRTIDPIVGAITEAMKRTFLSKTARTQGHSIEYFRHPFKLVPISQLADIADKFTRNEIVTSNEFRSIIGFRPVDDPKADELRNSNMPVSDTDPALAAKPSEESGDTDAIMQSAFDTLEETIDNIFAELDIEDDESEEDDDG